MNHWETRRSVVGVLGPGEEVSSMLFLDMSYELLISRHSIPPAQLHPRIHRSHRSVYSLCGSCRSSICRPIQLDVYDLDTLLLTKTATQPPSTPLATLLPMLLPMLLATSQCPLVKWI